MKALHVISFPKSGRTWLRVMLDDIGLNAKFSHDGADHILRCRLVDLQPDKSKYSALAIIFPGCTAIKDRVGLPVRLYSRRSARDCENLPF
jgi:hypothetical protein